MKNISSVFWVSIAILLIAVVYGVAAPSNFETITSNRGTANISVILYAKQTST